MPKVKVLHIIKSLGRGGAEMLLQETLRYHDQDRFEFHYIYFLPWKDQMVEGIKKEGGIVLNMPANNNWQIIRKSSEVFRYVQEHDIDLIHCHLPWAGFVGRRVFKNAGVPVIYTEHNKQERYHFATRMLNKLSFNNQAMAIAVSGDVAQSIKKNIRPRISVQTVLNGIDTAKFKRNAAEGKKIREQFNVPSDAIVLGNIAVFRFQKRLKEWVDLFADLYGSHPNIYGLLVGAGPLLEEVKSHIAAHGLRHRIITPGLQTDVLPWLSAIDIYVMTSEFEGLPIALLEAMSMECAVVCTDAGGIKEVIRDKRDGFLLPVHDWKQMKIPASDLIHNPAQILKWGRAARERVEDKFSIQLMVRHTEEIYFSLMAKKDHGDTKG